jgi:hypothetical protein
MQAGLVKIIIGGPSIIGWYLQTSIFLILTSYHSNYNIFLGTL